jgi:signal transduction histidine kinase
MTFTFLDVFPVQRILPPNGTLGWIAWLVLAAAVLWLVWRLREHNVTFTRAHWAWLLGLALLTPLSILVFTLRLPAENVLPIPALGAPALGPVLPVLAAIPWVLALALLGPLPGASLAALSGWLLSSWDTRSPFTPLEFALLAGLLAIALIQPYRTRLFGWLRHPLVAALLLSAFYPILYLVTAFFWASADPFNSLDFALSRLPWVATSVGLPLLVAAGVFQFLRSRVPLFSASQPAGQPAPSERSLEARLLFTLAPIVLLAFLALGVLAWWSAGRTAEQLLGDRALASAELAADSVPFFLETGQNLIMQLAGDSRLADASAADARSLLQNQIRAVPYFEQFVLLDTGGNTLVAFPAAEFSDLEPSQAELEAVSLAIQGMAFQALSVPPASPESTTAQLSFVAAVRNDNGQVRSVLLGRTNLASNPLAQPVLQGLDSVGALGGQGYLLDGEGNIVVAPNATAMLQPYYGRTSSAPLSYEDSGPDGSRRFVNYVPVTGSSWAVVTQWPSRLSQELALELALPILLVLVLLAAAAYVLLRVSLHAITSPLQELIGETRRIAAGDLKAPLSVKGADEVGRLATAFEGMRQALQARVGETQRLLSVSQGLTSSLDVGAHIEPVLEAALAGGAISARLIFSADADGKDLVGFGLGENAADFQALDEQVLRLSRKQRRVLLTNPARAQLKAAKGALPQSLAAFALQDSGGQLLGALWLAYDKPQAFKAETVRYLETLADQAAKAAANARLYTAASVGRQRLEAVLQADPEPRLVIDENQRIVFANLALANALKLSVDTAIGKPINEVIPVSQLAAWLRSTDAPPASVEVEIAGAPYQAEAIVLKEGPRSLGKLVTLRDLGRSKQVETARADFLSTLSHDLHDPLELTKGYLNMLGMVGDLNEQQAGYVDKIEHGLEHISRLAENLLDSERVSGLKGLQIQSVLPAELIQEACAELGPRARQKKIDFAIQKTQGQVQPLQADRALLQRALYNLLDNAIKFSPRESAVEIKTTYAKDKVTISVTDRGVGIAPLDLPRLFEAKPGRGSSGLPIVKSIVERHGGRLWAESELGTGSAFYMALPLAAVNGAGA